MATCAICGQQINFFTGIHLKDANICPNCYHIANHGDERIISEAWSLSSIKLQMKERYAQIEKFSPTKTFPCGLQFDDENKLFSFEGWTHRYFNIRSYNAFLNGRNIEYYNRAETYSNSDHVVIKKYYGTCIFLQMGDEYPLYLEIKINTSSEFEECLQHIKKICMFADEEKQIIHERVTKWQKEYELQCAEEKLKQQMRQIEKLKKELNQK